MSEGATGGMGVYKTEGIRRMVYPRVFATPIVQNNCIYVIGGCDQVGAPVDSFEVYDVAKNKWTTLKNMPTKRAAPAVGVIGDKIVVIGGVGTGQKAVNALEMYSIKDKTWTSLEPLPSPLLGVASVRRGVTLRNPDLFFQFLTTSSVEQRKDDRILAVGGMSVDTNPMDFFCSIDTEENKWKALPPMPTPRYALFAFLIGDNFYAIGGRRGKEPCVAFEVYNFTEEKWRKLPDVPSKRVFASYTCTNRHIFSVGGLMQPANKGFSDVCEVFDLEKEEWKIMTKMPTARGDFCIGVINDRVVCAGGLGNLGKAIESVEIFDVDTDSWSSGKDLSIGHCSAAHIVHDGKMYIMGGLSPQGPTSWGQCISFGEETEEKQDSKKAQSGKSRQKKQV